MSYTAPTGWIETLEPRDLEASSRLGVFHQSETCSNIKRSDQLREVDRPWSAKRCFVCAAAS